MTTANLPIENIRQYINTIWDEEIVPTLIEYVKIPNKSPQFDVNWQKNGFMDQAVALFVEWSKAHLAKNMQVEVVQLEDRTPVIFIEIPGTENETDDTVLLYGHLDKQPEMRGWDADLGPWKPVLRCDKLYGRGAADDGYALFASLTAVNALQQQNIPHKRCVILIEACEESGSSDLPFYVDALKGRIGQPSLVVCLDSGCGNYEQMWLTTSLRGLIGGILRIDVLKQGVHSGAGSGIAPSCLRIARQLLDRIEDKTTGNILLSALQVNIPEERKTQAEKAGEILGKSVFNDLPFVENVLPDSDSVSELILRRTWKSTLSIVGLEGIPEIANAGNVTLPSLALKFSIRIPPTCAPDEAAQVVKKILEQDPPNQAQVQFEIIDTGPGWNAPATEAWLEKAIHKASKAFFGRDAAAMGEGGSIPFMGMLGEKFPQAQFVITGVLGPKSNAHGPNEFLHIPTGKKLTACVASIIADHCVRQ